MKDQKDWWGNLYVAKSLQKNAGYGVFTRVAIKRDGKRIEGADYHGMIIDASVAKAMCDTAELGGVLCTGSHMQWLSGQSNLVISGFKKPGKGQQLGSILNTVLPGKKGERPKGERAHLINTKVELHFPSGTKDLGDPDGFFLKAKRDIAPGEELLRSYGTSTRRVFGGMYCKCPDCASVTPDSDTEEND